MLEKIIVISIIVIIISFVVMYLIKCKKRGQKCVGCPYCKTCHKNKITKEE